MRKITLLLAAMLAITVIMFGQEDYTMYKVMYMEPDYENLKELGEAMTDHNKTFHNEAPNMGHIWIVNTGPRTGHWLYVMGPITYTEMDAVDLDEDHMEHWIGKVLPNVEGVSNGGMWRMDDELSYEGTIGFTGKEVLTFYKLKDFDVLPTYNYTSPHNIQKWTSRTEGGTGCSSNCHLQFVDGDTINKELYLWKSDLLDWEISATGFMTMDGHVPSSWMK